MSIHRIRTLSAVQQTAGCDLEVEAFGCTLAKDPASQRPAAALCPVCDGWGDATVIFTSAADLGGPEAAGLSCLGDLMTQSRSITWGPRSPLQLGPTYTVSGHPGVPCMAQGPRVPVPTFRDQGPSQGIQDVSTGRTSCEGCFSFFESS